MRRSFLVAMACAAFASWPLSLAAHPSGAWQVASRPMPIFSPFSLPFPTAAPTVKPHLQNGDRAYMLIGGEWHCQTFAGTAFQRFYRRDEDAVSIIGESDVRIAGHTGKLVEVYRKHKGTNKWFVSLVGGQIVAVARPWRRVNWTFDGRDSELGADAHIRMVYRRYDDNVFEREFYHVLKGHAIPYAGESCIRKFPIGPLKGET